MTAALPALDRRTGYVAAVAAELADLAPDERAELVEELDDHVAALLEDRPDVDLVAELGTPRAYAAELRAAAGLVGPVARPSWSTRTADLGRRVRTALPWLEPTARFLRPAWWVLRGVVVGAAVALVLGFGYPSGGTYLLVALGVIGSLWLAQRAPATPRFRTGVRAVNVVAAVLTLYVASVVGVTRIQTEFSTQYVYSCPAAIDNLYAYDASGRPLQDVRLYDQDGNPFDISALGCNSNVDFAPGPEANVYPWPSAAADWQPASSGPPASLVPLPGASVPTSPDASPTGSTGATPTSAPTR